jgi:prepilin-type N-terminal cleavage/methylation domain-containing protein
MSRLRRPFRPRGGFTLIELLVVMAIIVVLTAITLPALSLLASRRFDGGVEAINSLLNLAREEARSKSTYTWVLFYPSAVPRPGTLIVVAIASADGTDPMAWGTYPNVIPDSTLELIARPLILSQIQLSTPGTLDGKISTLPSTGDMSNALNSTVQVTMKIPALGTITFAQAIRYLPSSGAGNNNATSKFIELDLQPLRGGTPDDKNVAVVRIDKASGTVQLYRP